MSTRKSKKGFQKLENHELELAEFTTMGNGVLESGSENDLLDMTATQEPKARSRCGSWCSCLALSFLALLVVLVGLYCGYLTYYLWLMNGNTSSTHEHLENRLASLESDFSKYKSVMGERFSGLQSELATLKRSMNTTHGALLRYHDNMGNSLAELGMKVDDIESRLEVIERQPQEKLISQVDLINKDMDVLTNSMKKLNKSLSDINQVKAQIAELGSVTSHYDDQFIQVKTGIATVRQESSGMMESVNAAVNTVAGFRKDLNSLSSKLSSSHEQMQQTTDLLSAQVTAVQERVGGLNDTLNSQVSKLWSNLTKVTTSLGQLSTEVLSLQENVTTQNSGIHLPEDPDHTSAITTTPPPEPPATEVDLMTLPDPNKATTAESTGATEDTVPVTTAEEVETTQPTPTSVDDGEIERQRSHIELELNRTLGAIDYLQGVTDNFNTLDEDGDEKLGIDEFIKQIPRSGVFDLLDNDKDSFLTYDEVLNNIDNLKRKSNALKAELKAFSQTEGPTDNGDTTTAADEFLLPLDPVLQEKLRELFDYINSHDN